jgi:hypothetical protein
MYHPEVIKFEMNNEINAKINGSVPSWSIIKKEWVHFEH